MTMSLENRVAVVTGASRGIGRGIAIELASRKAQVVLTYNTQKDMADSVVDAIREDGGKAVSVKMRAESRKEIEGTVNFAAEIFGSEVEILVNNAAISQEKPFLEICDDDFDRLMAINLRSAVAASQIVIPGMVQRGFGRIINIASVGGQWGGMNQVHYALSKAGLIALTKSIAKLYSRSQITCNAVSPGLVATDMAERELTSDSGRRKVENIPAGRVGRVEEVAGAVAFLSSPAASYVTGQTLNLNGGMYMG